MSALKAFRKRLKVTQLDQESKIGHGPFSKGAGGGAFAIQPPSGYPRTVWDELARQGKIKHTGGGLYTLVG
ncbi:MAG: hypothetical protein JNM07_06405 [Phycisphaerae bacterium]|nr:hypothetical protein [Phycisphaerae bacterium]